ncbi:helix-turn-helix transcriptional regulator [Candidatus Bathyarchaeota archaeon]|nr:helix-turn-helix transcriptional regulator [Candidatus Bathyarchaeota archaeon]
MVRTSFFGEDEIIKVLGKNIEADIALDRIAKALSSRMRRLILWLLLEKEELGLSQLIKLLKMPKSKKPLLRYHLKILCETGLIEVSKVKWSGMTISAKYYVLSDKAKALLDNLTMKVKKEKRWLPPFSRRRNGELKLERLY